MPFPLIGDSSFELIRMRCGVVVLRRGAFVLQYILGILFGHLVISNLLSGGQQDDPEMAQASSGK
jgi:hypothetical protein